MTNSEANTDVVIQEHRVPATDNIVLKIIAKIVSYILHPVFMPILMALVLFSINPSSYIQYKGRDLGLVFLTIGMLTIFFPVLVVLLMKGLGFVKSIFLRNQKERIVPLLATMIFYWWVSHVFKNQSAPLILQVLLRGAYWGIIVLFVCSIFYKISMHTMAAGGMIGFLIVLSIISPIDMTVPFLIAIVIAGLSGTARMLLGAHTPFEIWTGYIFGVLSQLAAYWYLI